MVAVKMAEEHFVDGEIDPQRLGVLDDRVGPGAGVEQNAMSVGFDHGGEPPFADAGFGEHRREDADLQLLHTARGSLRHRGERKGKKFTAVHCPIVSNAAPAPD